MDLDVSGIEQVQAMLGGMPQQVKQSLKTTLNQTAQISLDEGVKEITKQANLAEAYVRQRLTTRKPATLNNLEVIVGARSRGTGLRRFAAQQEHKAGKTKDSVPGGVSVDVKGGQRKLMPGAFFINLNNGNQHLAYRPVPGSRKYSVLYGPSVSQIFKTVRNEVGETSEQLLERFLNQLSGI